MAAVIEAAIPRLPRCQRHTHSQKIIPVVPTWYRLMVDMHDGFSDGGELGGRGHDKTCPRSVDLIVAEIVGSSKDLPLDAL